MKKLLIYYNFILVTVIVIGGFMSSTTIPQLISAIIFYPLFAYLFLLVVPTTKKPFGVVSVPPVKKLPLTTNTQLVVTSDQALDGRLVTLPHANKKGIDIDRRAFLKLIGTASLSLFMLTLFTKKAEAAFFGSVPGPGTVGVKNTTGVTIDPAESQPTDGYSITQIDDSPPMPDYYGYVHKSGAWYIVREDASGGYRYTKGASGFSTNWTNRAVLTYDYFDNIF